MDLTFTPEQDAFRAEIRAWLADNVPKAKLPSLDSREGFKLHRDWERALYDGGWAMVNWPVEYGGRGAGLMEWLIFEEEYWRAGAPLRVNQNGIFLLGPTLMHFGTPEQKARFLPPMASGEHIWAQGWSEPGAGSDMAAIRSTARLDGDHYVLNGQKIWSSRAAFADWMFGLFRSDPDEKRHRGLTFILVPLDAPGITVRPIAQLDGETGFAEVFFDDVRVPVDQRLGNHNEGWNVFLTTAGVERGLYLRSPARFQETAKKLVALYREQGEVADAAARDDVLQTWMDAEAFCLGTFWTASKFEAGESIGSESSCTKIFWSELDIAAHETALRLLGPEAFLLGDGDPENEGHAWLDGFLFSIAGPIYAGTNEIQRDIVAERVLGLPRSR
jgi:alkylation response protein AidB-like acyl-CoA dehydrogenase